MTKISIVMSVYNGAPYIKETLQSIINQTVKDFELIIIDNRSTDDTALIVKQFTEQYKNIIYYYHDIQTKLSFPAGLNKGFSLAKGEYWTKIDADDFWHPNALERMMFELDAFPNVDFVYCDMQIIDAVGNFIGYSKARPIEDLIFSNVIGGCILFRSNLAKKVGSFNEKEALVEDYDYWLRCNEKGTLKPINECLYYCRKHGNNISEQYENEQIQKTMILQKKYYKQYITTRRKAALFYAFTRSMNFNSPFRQFYLLLILYYSPSVFFHVVYYRTIPEQ